MGERWRPGSRVRLTVVLLAAAAGIVVAAPAAHGQAPADQYIPSPKPSDSGGNDRDPAREQSEVSGSGADDFQTAFGPASEPPSGSGGKTGGGGDSTGSGGDAARVAGGIGSPAGDDDGGGYPLTPFATVVIALLALGMLASMVAAVRGRLRSAS